VETRNILGSMLLRATNISSDMP